MSNAPSPNDRGGEATNHGHEGPLEWEMVLAKTKQITLNPNCFTGITGNEFHYAYYEKGSFY